MFLRQPAPLFISDAVTLPCLYMFGAVCSLNAHQGQFGELEQRDVAAAVNPFLVKGGTKQTFLEISKVNRGLINKGPGF